MTNKELVGKTLDFVLDFDEAFRNAGGHSGVSFLIDHVSLELLHTLVVNDLTVVYKGEDK